MGDGMIAVTRRSAGLVSLVCLCLMSAASSAAGEVPFGLQQRVSTMGADGDPAFGAASADVAYDSSERDRYIVVWQGTQSRTQGPEIYGKLMSRNNARIGPDFKISDTPGQLASAAPAVVFNSERDEFLVVWKARHDAAEPMEIYAQRLAPNGNRLAQDDLPVSTPESLPAPVGSDPDLAYDAASGDSIAVWRTGDENDGEIYGQRLTGTGALLGAGFQVSTTGATGSDLRGAYDPAVAYDSVSGRFLVAWSGDDAFDGEREIYTRAYMSDGSPLTGQTRVSHMGPDAIKAFDAFEPSLAFNATTSEYLLVWRGDTAGQDDEFEVYGQRLDASGGEVGATDFRISDMGPDGGAYAVGGRPTVEHASVPNRYLVLWHGDDNTPPLAAGETEIFAQALGAQGNEIGANDFRVTTYGGAGTPAESPAVAYDPAANQSLVAFEGTGAAPLAVGETEIFSMRVGADSDGDGVLDGFDACRTVSGGSFDIDGDGCPDDRDADGEIDALDACPAVAGGAFDADRDGCPDDRDGDGVLDAGDPCQSTPGGPLDANHNGCPGPFGSVDRARLSTSVLDSQLLPERRRYIVVRYLRFRDLPATPVSVSLGCIRRCAIVERLRKPAGPRIIASRRFKNQRLSSGSIIRARIVAPDLVGAVRRYVVRGGEIVQLGSPRCIPIGARKAQRTCDGGR
jgi:hypothetical protein